MLKDASMEPYANALCARVQAHTGLPIYFSMDRFREIQNSIQYVGDLGCWNFFHRSIITIFGGELILRGGLSFRFQSCEDPMAIQLIVKLSKNKNEGDESLKFEIYDLGERYCYKLPEGTSFEALLDMFESGAEYYEEDRDEWEVEKLGE